MLQARTSALTSCRSSQSTHSSVKRRTSSAGRGPRRALVVAQVDGRLLRQPPPDLGQHRQPAHAGVEDPDRPGVGGTGHAGASAGRENGARSRRCEPSEAAMCLMPCEMGASGLPDTNGTPSLLAATTRRPSETSSKSMGLPRAVSTSALLMPPVESDRFRTVASLSAGSRWRRTPRRPWPGCGSPSSRR